MARQGQVTAHTRQNAKEREGRSPRGAPPPSAEQPDAQKGFNLDLGNLEAGRGEERILREGVERKTVGFRTGGSEQQAAQGRHESLRTWGCKGGASSLFVERHENLHGSWCLTTNPQQ